MPPKRKVNSNFTMNDLKSRATGKEIPKEEKPIEKATIVDLRDPELIAQLRSLQNKLYSSSAYLSPAEKAAAEKSEKELLQKLNESQHEALHSEKVKSTLQKDYQATSSVEVSALETHLLSGVKLATSNRASSDPKAESTLQHDFFSRLLKDDAEFITMEFQTGVKVLPPLFTPDQTVYVLQHLGDSKTAPTMLAEVVLLIVSAEKKTTELIVVELKCTSLNNPSVYLKEGGKTETGITHFYAHNQAIEGVAPLSNRMFLDLVHQGATKLYGQRLARYFKLSLDVSVSSVTCVSIIGNYWDSSKAGIWSVPLRTVAVNPRKKKEEENTKNDADEKQQTTSSKAMMMAKQQSDEQPKKQLTREELIASIRHDPDGVMMWEDSHAGQLQTSAYGRKYLS